MQPQQPPRKLVDLPDTMKRLPRDKRGFPVPEFVHWIDGEPDFRIIKPGWLKNCVRNNKCWLCGGVLGARKWFVIGPMCCVNRVSSEPPAHRQCAEFAVKNCPFLTKPLAKRNDRDWPEGNKVDPPGVMITRNPGVAAIWETTTYKPFGVDHGVLFELGEPTGVTFWREGRPATLDEVRESIKTGLPLLLDAAAQDGQDALRALFEQVETTGQLIARFLSPGVIGRTAH
jgi:hypothetical protein